MGPYTGEVLLKMLDKRFMTGLRTVAAT